MKDVAGEGNLSITHKSGGSRFGVFFEAERNYPSIQALLLSFGHLMVLVPFQSWVIELIYLFFLC
jgi:hypothetical protein